MALLKNGCESSISDSPPFGNPGVDTYKRWFQPWLLRWCDFWIGSNLRDFLGKPRSTAMSSVKAGRRGTCALRAASTRIMCTQRHGAWPIGPFSGRALTSASLWVTFIWLSFFFFFNSFFSPAAGLKGNLSLLFLLFFPGVLSKWWVPYSTLYQNQVGIMWEHVALHQTWFGGSGRTATGSPSGLRLGTRFELGCPFGGWFIAQSTEPACYVGPIPLSDTYPGGVGVGSVPNGKLDVLSPNGCACSWRTLSKRWVDTSSLVTSTNMSPIEIHLRMRLSPGGNTTSQIPFCFFLKQPPKM